MSLNETPRADRLHIAIFGRRNSGKSSLINMLTGQDIALVSDAPGTTTDPVYKSMEMHPVGPVVLIDTAGYDDEGELGSLRVERTRDVLDKTDIGVIVIDSATALSQEGKADAFDFEKGWISDLRERNIPVIIALNKSDLLSGSSCESNAESKVRHVLGKEADELVCVSALTGAGADKLRELITKAVPDDFYRRRILGDMVSDESLVLLVMPQDIQAPKGRLILPQVQTIRELLDKKCTTVATTAGGFERALANLSRDPDLIITDSQCFKMVHEKKPEGVRLTSFSILFASYKGDIEIFTDGASQLDDMTENSKVLIAEACTHVPLNEDIGRVKIPKLLRKNFGENIEITNVCGSDFPEGDELKKYDLIIHCGACMFNRAHVMSRIAAARDAGVPITNYGIAIAKLNGILDKIEIPGN